MDGAQVGFLEEFNQVRLRRLLEGEDGRRLEANVLTEVLGDLANEALEGGLADQELRRLLVLTDLAKGDGSRTVTVGLLDASCRSGCPQLSVGLQSIRRREMHRSSFSQPLH